MSIITVKNLSKRFREENPVKTAFINRFSNILNMGKKNKPQPLNNVSFDIKKGESLGPGHLQEQQLSLP